MKKPACREVKEMKKILAALSALCAAVVAVAQTEITADFTETKTPVSPYLFGIFYEDINYAADGGLYGELIQNRSFEFSKSGKSFMEYWNPVSSENEVFCSRITECTESPLNKNNTVFLRLNVRQPGDGISNSGYDGINVKAGKIYPLSLYLRSPDSSVDKVQIELRNRKTLRKLFKTEFEISSEWKKYHAEVIPEKSCEEAELLVTVSSSDGTVDVDFVSLFASDIYNDEENGLKENLVLMLKQMKPGFIRFPGGCIVHGYNLENSYNWKDTVGPVEERKEKANFWGYQQSYGLGFYEYFRLCEDIGSQPLPVLRAGVSHYGHTCNSDELMQLAQDALDLIEWATGSRDSEWGKIRAEAGHPEPFELNYIGIGNEDCGEDYFYRYSYIASKIKEKYPEIKTVISSGYTYDDVNFHNAWNKVNEWEGSALYKNTVDLVDEHYYNPSAWFLMNSNRYDDREFYKTEKSFPKVFIGEYASWVEGRRGNLFAALTEAAYMTGIERNGDVIELASYAPLFARENHVQWIPDAVWFNDESVYGTPSYYVQSMFMNNKTDFSIKTAVENNKTIVDSHKMKGSVGLATWQTQAEYSNIKVTDISENKILYDSSSEKMNMKKLNVRSGSWSIKNNSLIQSDEGDNMRLTFEKLIKPSENYDFEVTARKIRGNEGFLIMFGVSKENFYWWNIGGWGNTQSCVQKGTAPSRTVIGDSKNITVESDREYKIKIEVRGDTYRCYLDGELLHEFTDCEEYKKIFAHVGETENEVIIKIVNAGNRKEKCSVVLNGADMLNPDAQIITLSGRVDSENSFENPCAVCPEISPAVIKSPDFTYTVKPYSFTIIKLTKKK